MTTIPNDRPAWRDLPELRIAAPSTSRHAGIPAHIDAALRRRYAHPSTVNHDAWRDAHCRCMATGAAPSAPLLPRRRRRSLWGIVANVALATLAVLAVIGAFALMRGLLGGL